MREIRMSVLAESEIKHEIFKKKIDLEAIFKNKSLRR